MLKLILIMLLAGLMNPTALWAGEGDHLYDLKTSNTVDLSDELPRLLEKRVILAGEHHNNQRHHEIQLRIIQALHEGGAKVAIGLEMFRNESQADLDRWVAGDISESKFKKIYYDNWNFDWTAYRMIFDYARKNKLPMIGLNVSREITQQVAKQGFESLNAEQRGKLSNVTCRVDPEYMAYVRSAFGAHAHGGLNFTFFCEAQLVWDKVMAIHTLDYLAVNPESIVVVITGTGHAWKKGIPEQIRQRSNLPVAVIMPQTKGLIEPNTVTIKEADYIFLDM